MRITHRHNVSPASATTPFSLSLFFLECKSEIYNFQKILINADREGNGIQLAHDDEQ